MKTKLENLFDKFEKINNIRLKPGIFKISLIINFKHVKDVKHDCRATDLV